MGMHIERARLTQNQCSLKQSGCIDAARVPGRTGQNTMRFNRWELDPIRRVLIVGGTPVDVGSRAFDVLLALVHHQGRTVTKRQLLDAAWGDLAVEENNISVQISNLRKVLGADVIATIPAIGYRLTAAPADGPATAPVRQLVDGVAQSSSASRARSRASEAPLVGREADRQALVERLLTSQLVSIVGTGGVGKTSIAGAIVDSPPFDSSNGTCWVDLSSLQDGSQFIPALAKALGVDIEVDAVSDETLLQALERMKLLVVLDNCEHLLTSVASFLANALRQSPDVRWLITSQQPMQVQGEVVYRLGSLAVPPDAVDLHDAEAYGAVALLCRCASAADRHFELTQNNLSLVVDLCRQLDGLPLAIEMAASRMATLGLSDVHAQLDRRLRLLAGPRTGPDRHHTLRSTLDWSHGLLSAMEQRVFRRLQPFVGGFNMRMASLLVRQIDTEREGVAVDEWDILEALSGLVNKSLVQRYPAEADRYHLLESTRSFASERLTLADEALLAQRSHARVLADAMRPAQSDFMVMSDAAWGKRYLPERANVLQAVDWACKADEPDVLAVLAAALAQMDGYVQTQPEIVRLCLPLEVLARAQPSLRAVAYVEVSWAHYTAGDRELGTRLASLALDDFRAIGDVAGQYRALSQLIRLYESRPGTLELARETAAARELIDVRQLPLRTRLAGEIASGLYYDSSPKADRLQALLEAADRSGFEALGAICRVRITDQLLVQSHFEDVVSQARVFEAAVTRWPRLKGLVMSNRLLALVQLGRTDEARVEAVEVLRTSPGAAHPVMVSFALAAARDGRFADSALMSGHAARIREVRGQHADPAEATAIAEALAVIRKEMSELSVDELMDLGASMATRDVLTLALRA